MLFRPGVDYNWVNYNYFAKNLKFVNDYNELHQCGQSFALNNYPKRYDIIHTINKPYGCATCGDRSHSL